MPPAEPHPAAGSPGDLDAQVENLLQDVEPAPRDVAPAENEQDSTTPSFESPEQLDADLEAALAVAVQQAADLREDVGSARAPAPESASAQADLAADPVFESLSPPGETAPADDDMSGFADVAAVLGELPPEAEEHANGPVAGAPKSRAELDADLARLAATQEDSAAGPLVPLPLPAPAGDAAPAAAGEKPGVPAPSAPAAPKVQRPPGPISRAITRLVLKLEDIPSVWRHAAAWGAVVTLANAVAIWALAMTRPAGFAPPSEEEVLQIYDGSGKDSHGGGHGSGHGDAHGAPDAHAADAHGSSGHGDAGHGAKPEKPKAKPKPAPKKPAKAKAKDKPAADSGHH